MAKWNQQLMDDLEMAQRSGDIQTLRRFLKSLNVAKIPRHYRYKVANFARRNFQFYLGLRILNPVIRPKISLKDRATPHELDEYAALLVGIGSHFEAKDILSSIPKGSTPQAYLSEAFLHIAEWNYIEAIPLLEKYIDSHGLPIYAHMIGRLNLAASLVVVDDFKKAKPILNQLIKDSDHHGFNLIKGNALEVLGQCFIGQQDYKKARKSLEESESVFKSMDTWNDLFIKKWWLVLDLLESKYDQRTLNQRALQILKSAQHQGHWETLRELDFYFSTESKNKNQFLNLLFSTPYPAYRKKMQDQMPRDWVIPETFVTQSHPFKKSRYKQVYNIERSLNHKDQRIFKEGQNLHLLLQCLSSDLYKPHKLGQIHSTVFQGEYFNPISTPDKIHQLIKRFRQELRKQELGLKVIEHYGAYQLLTASGVGLKMTLKSSVFEAYEIRWLKIKNFGNYQKKLPAKEICRLLDVSKSEGHRWITWAVERGHLEKKGRGPSTHYLLKSA